MTDIDLAIIKVKYNQAIEDGKDSFIVYGQTLLVAYAKYLIENEENKVQA